MNAKLDILLFQLCIINWQLEIVDNKINTTKIIKNNYELSYEIASELSYECR